MEVGEKVRNGYIGNVCVVVLVSINSNYVVELVSRKRAVHWTQRKYNTAC